VRPEQPAPTTIPQNPYASKPKENSFENKSLKYVADSVSKTMYPFHCAETTKIKTENRVPVFGLEEATEKGFTLSKICTKPKIAAAAKPAKEKTPALGKTTEAINILAIKTYPESWSDRPIILKAGISLPEPRDKEEFGEKRFAQAFILRDRSERMYIIVQEGKAADILRKRIIFNDGFPVNGTFTFVINSDVYKTLGATGILQSFSLEQ
jgi:hypothetical protein